MTVTLPSTEVTVGIPHASVAVAVPRAPLISAEDGLHPSVNEPPPVVIVGGFVSNVKVTLRELVAVLPHPSVAV